jgi:hypothetical protein
MSFWDQYFLPRRFISTGFGDINFFRFFRFSPILTLWTFQTAVTRSFMVRFEKFLQFWNGHDVASRGGASDTRLRSRRVWRSFCLTTPLRPFFVYISISTFAMSSDISKTNSHWLMKFGQLVVLDESYRWHSIWSVYLSPFPRYTGS